MKDIEPSSSIYEQGKEPHTPGILSMIISSDTEETMEDDLQFNLVGTVSQTTVTNDTKREDIVPVALFARMADLRRAAACINSFAGVPTELVEQMPYNARELIVLYRQAITAIQATRAAAIGTDEEWEELRESFIKAHEQTIQSSARPN